MAIQSRSVKEKDIAQNRELIESNPIWQRTRLSRELCREWGSATRGRGKDVACRTLLLELEDLGCLTFPKGQGTPHRPVPERPVYVWGSPPKTSIAALSSS